MGWVPNVNNGTQPNRGYQNRPLCQEIGHATVHISYSIKSWRKMNKVKTLQWPSRSHNLNPMENFWGILARDVYKNAQQNRSMSRSKTRNRKWLEQQCP
ncbi:hypothetical protein AVEN_168717-1 [Araneus ventricosus]|uniref:Tc1-like transposase DDE domain-containing protein n=1 Tax=Araneus ventricosus TaxID=182803 RepID=A0A4Y2C621_ARAVE|nr:hypothetical protein AVEN_168717-1 [Araneus ventricosus]